MLSVLLALAAPSALAVTWPADSDWEVVELDGDPLTDPCNDVSGSDWWDIVGDSSEPAAYMYDDGTYLWFRLRLAADSYSKIGRAHV